MKEKSYEDEDYEDAFDNDRDVDAVDEDDPESEPAPVPGLCLNCVHYDNAAREVECNLIRVDQLDEAEFRCSKYRTNAE